MNDQVESQVGCRARSDVDWEAVERDYRAGLKSLRQIGKEHDVTHAAIRKRAAKEEWSRDLGARIRAAADAELARAEVSSDPVSRKVSADTDRDIVRANAQIQVAIVREHRRDIQRARGLSRRLMFDLETAAGARETLQDIAAEVAREDKSPRRREFLMRAVGLSEHASTFESLTRSLKTLVALERQAFGIEPRPGEDPPVSQPTPTPVMPSIDYRAFRERLKGRPGEPEMDTASV